MTKHQTPSPILVRPLVVLGLAACCSLALTIGACGGDDDVAGGGATNPGGTGGTAASGGNGGNGGGGRGGGGGAVGATCATAGYRCCPACEPGTAASEYDDDCGAQVCCADCFEVPPVEVHFVTETGGSQSPRTGGSWDSAWSATEFNDPDHWSSASADDGTMGPGDTVYFAGEFTTELVVPSGGSSVGSVTLDGWEGGDCDPIHQPCTDAAFLRSGLSIGGGDYGPDYVTVQDFEVTNQSSGAGILLYGRNTSGSVDENMITHVIVQRNYVHETNGSLFYVSSWGEAGPYEHIVVRDNKMVNFGQNGGDPAQGIDLVNMSHSLVQHNEFGHVDADYPSGCQSAEMIELHGCHQILLEYNDIYGAPNQSGIRPKEWAPQSDIVIRFNKVHDNHSRVSGGEQAGKGIYAYGAVIDDIYIYANAIYNNHQWGVGASQTVGGMRVWSNVIASNGQHGFISFYNNGGTQSDFTVTNNTFVRNGDRDESEDTRAGIVLTSGTGFRIENNLLWNNRPGGAESHYWQIFSLEPIDVLEHNTFFHGAAAATVYYEGAARTLGMLQSDYGFEDDSPVGTVEDPLFVDPAGADGVFGTEDDDYTLGSASPVIGAGADLTESYSVDLSAGDAWFETHTGYTVVQMSTSTALDPATDWTGQPSAAKVRTATQGQHGAWERGAYAHP